MKEEMIKALLYWLAATWLGMLPIIYQILWSVDIRPLYIIGIVFILGAGDAIFWIYLKIVWGIEKKDVKPIEPPVVFNYNMDTATIDDTTGDIGRIEYPNTTEE